MFVLIAMKEGMKILMAYDGSTHADNAMKEAVDVAKKFKGSVEVIHCAWEETQAESQEILEKHKQMLEDAGVKYKLREERTERPGPRLVKIANSENFHLVVMGTRGLGAARSIMLGSVSSHVIEKVDMPVMVVK